MQPVFRKLDRHFLGDSEHHSASGELAVDAPRVAATGNVVASTSVGQLRIRYFGQGLIKDSLKPGFLVRLINRVF